MRLALGFAMLSFFFGIVAAILWGVLRLKRHLLAGSTLSLGMQKI